MKKPVGAPKKYHINVLVANASERKRCLAKGEKLGFTKVQARMLVAFAQFGIKWLSEEQAAELLTLVRAKHRETSELIAFTQRTHPASFFDGEKLRHPSVKSMLLHPETDHSKTLPELAASVEKCSGARREKLEDNVKKQNEKLAKRFPGERTAQ